MSSERAEPGSLTWLRADWGGGGAFLFRGVLFLSLDRGWLVEDVCQDMKGRGPWRGPSAAWLCPGAGAGAGSQVSSPSPSVTPLLPSRVAEESQSCPRTAAAQGSPHTLCPGAGWWQGCLVCFSPGATGLHQF